MKSVSRATSLIVIVLSSVVMNTRSQDVADRASEIEAASELSRQVLSLYNEKKFAEALPLAQKALEIRRRLFAPNDPLVSAALINLGELHLIMNKDREAEAVFKEALTINENQAVREQMTISRLLENVAYITIRKHDLKGAEPLLLRSLAIQEKELGPANPKTIEAMKIYACLNIRIHGGSEDLAQHNDTEAGKLQRRALCWLGELVKDCSQSSEIQSENVVNGKAVRLVTPSYPLGVRQQRVSGRVFVAILIDENGDVIAANPVCGGVPELNNASVDAARRSKFSTTRVNNKPIRVTGLIVYNFFAG